MRTVSNEWGRSAKIDVSASLKYMRTVSNERYSAREPRAEKNGLLYTRHRYASARSTSIVLEETKSVSMRTVSETLPGAAVEVVPAIPKDWRPAQRAGVAEAIQPGLP